MGYHIILEPCGGDRYAAPDGQYVANEDQIGDAIVDLVNETAVFNDGDVIRIFEAKDKNVTPESYLQKCITWLHTRTLVTEPGR